MASIFVLVRCSQVTHFTTLDRDLLPEEQHLLVVIPFLGRCHPERTEFSTEIFTGARRDIYFLTMRLTFRSLSGLSSCVTGRPDW